VIGVAERAILRDRSFGFAAPRSGRARLIQSKHRIPVRAPIVQAHAGAHHDELGCTDATLQTLRPIHRAGFVMRLPVFLVSYPPRTVATEVASGCIDFAEILGREFDGCCANVFFEALSCAGTGDRNDIRLLSKQPGPPSCRRAGCGDASAGGEPPVPGRGGFSFSLVHQGAGLGTLPLGSSS
jgi:hypothetical protein